MRRGLWWLLALSVIVLCMVTKLSVTAQRTEGSVLVASLTEDGIQIYAVDTAGEQTLVTSLPEFRVGEPVNEDLWYLGTTSSLTVSLDGSRLAFTAQRSGEWALFVYELAADALLEAAIPTDSRPVWSPDSDAILLAGGNIPPDDDYVFEVAAERLVRLTNTSDYDERRFNWLPDSSGLFYVGLYSECETCDATQALYLVSRDGSETRLLAQAAALTPADSYDTVCHPTWSEPNQRIYFIIGCVGGGTQSDEYLYSVDLSGDVRAEISGGLNSLYPNEYSVSSRSIHPNTLTNDLYLTIGSQGGGEEGRGLLNWRILHLLSTNEVAPVYERTMQNDDLDSSSMSPDGASMALVTYGKGAASNGFLEVVDLATGQLVVGRDATLLDVCDVSWEDEHTLFYTVDSTGECVVDRGPRSVWVQDTASGATQEVTGGLGDHVSIVRQVVVTSPIVVTPTP